jgi:hypothetical protein
LGRCDGQARYPSDDHYSQISPEFFVAGPLSRLRYGSSGRVLRGTAFPAATPRRDQGTRSGGREAASPVRAIPCVTPSRCCIAMLPCPTVASSQHFCGCWSALRSRCSPAIHVTPH